MCFVSFCRLLNCFLRKSMKLIYVVFFAELFIMSGWSAYTDCLNANGNVESSAILGFPDGGLWAASGLALQGTEGAIVAARFASPRSGAKLIIGGVSYMATNCTGDFLTGKSGPTGICVAKSGKAVIVCKAGQGMNIGSTLNAAMSMAEDLVSKGF